MGQLTSFTTAIVLILFATLMLAGEDLVDPESDHQNGQTNDDVNDEFLCQFNLIFRSYRFGEGVMCFAQGVMLRWELSTSCWTILR